MFFVKQKTAYEIKECDWSSDMCSSDLIRSKRLSTVRIGGYYFIDIEKSPPERRVNPHEKPEIGKANLPPGIDYGNLITPEQFANSRKMRASRIYRAILTGQLRAVIAGDTVFVDKGDVEDFLKAS